MNKLDELKELLDKTVSSYWVEGENAVSFKISDITNLEKYQSFFIGKENDYIHTGAFNKSTSTGYCRIEAKN